MNLRETLEKIEKSLRNQKKDEVYPPGRGYSVRLPEGRGTKRAMSREKAIGLARTIYESEKRS